ncbi:DUF4268 domain-containing protein [Nibribacter koreensis]|uniref:DUF4268 domain-containing protein n=1 Tax=Nibribacter koreensis TaxID=1084519 RepID=A0ABP8F5T3_9BACT
MYLINPDTNSLSKVDQVTFTDLQYSERYHLQEWLAKNPETLGEDFLIIQKEFSGFDDTSERLDLLALDKQYNLVVIENKLDDSGRDVVWQALKYASYCSTLSGTDIIQIYQGYLEKYFPGEQAIEKLHTFFENDDDYEQKLNQENSLRIVLVAARFRKEVTSTVLWLLNYGIKLQCHRVTPYKMGEKALLNVEQIIPLRDAEDYTIRLAKKAQDLAQVRQTSSHRHDLRKEFWLQLLPEINKRTSLFQNINATKDHWLSAGSGMRSCPYSFNITWQSASVMLNFTKESKAENDALFLMMLTRRDEIEKAFGEVLIWDTLDGRKSSRIEFKKEGLNYFEKSQWPEIISFLVDAMVRLEKALKKQLSQVASQVSTQNLHALPSTV